MKTPITFIGTNSATSHLHNQNFDAEIVFLESKNDQANVHLIKLADRNLLFDIKSAKVLDFVVLEGILQDEDKLGRAAIQLC